MTEEEKKVIEYYRESGADTEIEFDVRDCDWEAFKRLCGFTEEDSFEKHKMRVNVLLKTIDRLYRQVRIKDAYCELLCDIAVDYDGFYTVSGLKDLVDELVGLAKKAIENDDKSVAYWSLEDGKEYNLNILEERIGEREGKKWAQK